MKKLVPLILALFGIGAGVGAGLFLKPAPEEVAVAASPCGEVPHDAAGHGDDAAGSHDEASSHDEEGEATHEYVKLNNQFVVPVVGDERVESMVVLSLSVEVASGRQEEIFAREPKLRDAFLQVLFDHANMGGFRGAFTNSNNMDVLRQALNETARKIAGDLVTDILIVDINRQDV